MMPPARQCRRGPLSPARNSSATASFTRVGICSERRKYSCAASFEVAAVERHQPLITAHFRALIDGHGEMAAAQEPAGIGLARSYRGRDARRVEARAGPHIARRGEIDHQHAHRAVALGLQDEAALEFEARAEHDGEHDGLAEQFCHRRGVIVTAQNGVDHGTQPHDAAADVERLDRERQDRVVETVAIGLANRNGDIGLIHRAII